MCHFDFSVRRSSLQWPRSACNRVWPFSVSLSWFYEPAAATAAGQFYGRVPVATRRAGGAGAPRAPAASRAPATLRVTVTRLASSAPNTRLRRPLKGVVSALPHKITRGKECGNAFFQGGWCMLQEGRRAESPGSCVIERRRAKEAAGACQPVSTSVLSCCLGLMF